MVVPGTDLRSCRRRLGGDPRIATARSLEHSLQSPGVGSSFSLVAAEPVQNGDLDRPGSRSHLQSDGGPGHDLRSCGRRLGGDPRVATARSLEQSSQSAGMGPSFSVRAIEAYK